MSEGILRQLERIKQIFVKQDKVVINSWDINYHEQLKRFEKRVARFVVEEEGGDEDNEGMVIQVNDMLIEEEGTEAAASNTQYTNSRHSNTRSRGMNIIERKNRNVSDD